MRTCPTCGEMLHPGQSICDNCNKIVSDGCRVKSWGQYGTAFMRNAAGQWLVIWDNGTIDLCHQSNLERD